MIMVISEQIELFSDGHFNVINITNKVKEFVEKTGLKNGQVFVFLQHTTGSIIIGEHETGIMADLSDILDTITPPEYPYKHHIRAVDYNGHGYIRAALMQPGVNAPFVNGKLALGNYQDFLVIDDQVDAEPRYVILQAMGE